MQPIYLQLLFLIVVANGAPILARIALGGRAARPLDGGRVLADGQPLLGRSKTWRGVLAAPPAGAVAAAAIGLPPLDGALIGAAAMLGDLASSFLKRRLRLAPSAMALGIDQVPECALPLLLLADRYALQWIPLVATVALFVVIELLLSRILYLIGIRRHPY